MSVIPVISNDWFCLKRMYPVLSYNNPCLRKKRGGSIIVLENGNWYYNLHLVNWVKGKCLSLFVRVDIESFQIMAIYFNFIHECMITMHHPFVEFVFNELITIVKSCLTQREHIIFCQSSIYTKQSYNVFSTSFSVCSSVCCLSNRLARWKTLHPHL